MKYVGRRSVLGIAKEAVRGTALAPTYYIPNSSISFDQKAVTVDSEGAFNNIADGYEAHVVKKYGEGEFEADLDDKAIGVVLCGVMGAAPVSAGSTNFTHTYSVTNTNTHQSLSVYVGDPNTATLFPRAMVDTFSLSVEPEGIAKYTVGLRSTKGRDWTTLTPDYTALGNKFLHTHSTFKVAANLAALAAASAIDIRSLTFNVTKNVVDFDDIGTVTPADILNQQMGVDGSLEIAYSDQVYRDYMLNGDYKAVEIKFTYGANNYLTIQLPRVSFRSWEASKGLNDIATQTIDFKAFYDAANADNAIDSIVLANQVSSY